MNTVAAPLLVLHDIGGPGGGRPWREAFEAAGWEGPIDAPDLPGHAAAPAPVGGSYELTDAVLAVTTGAGAETVVVGVGANGWAAHLLALGGRAAALVLVDGLGDPWRDPPASVDAAKRLLRAIADDPAALEPVPAGVSLDPRLRHVIDRHGNRALAERAAAATSVPAVLVDAAGNGVAHDLAPLFKTGAVVVEAPSADPGSVAGTVLTVMTGLGVPGTSGGA